jgi:predicted  nucleic acid-binding Zn-ribbon protein
MQAATTAAAAGGIGSASAATDVEKLAADLAKVELEIERVTKAISNLEETREIEHVTKAISAIEDTLLNAESVFSLFNELQRRIEGSITDWMGRLRDEKQRLSERERQLRGKEDRLREKENLLLEKERQLREEKARKELALERAGESFCFASASGGAHAQRLSSHRSPHVF